MNTFFKKNDAVLSRNEMRSISGGRPPMDDGGMCCWEGTDNCSECVGYHGGRCTHGEFRSC